MVCVVVAPVLALAGGILFLFPGSTTELWAWTLKPIPSATTVGGGYLGGVWFFSRAVRDGRAISTVGGLAAASPFTALLLIETVVHWDKFNHDHPSFWAWLALYIITPILLPVLAVSNARRGGLRTVRATAAPLNRPAAVARIALGVVGASQTVAGLAWFVAPSVAIERWPWVITPLAVRTIASFMVFTGIMLFWPVVDRSWASSRFGIEAVVVGLCFTGIGAARSWSHMAGTVRQATYVGALVVVLALCVAAVATAPRPPTTNLMEPTP